MFTSVVIYAWFYRRRRTCLLWSCDQVKCAGFVFIFSLGCSCLNNVLSAWCMLLQTEVKVFCVHCFKTCTFQASELINPGPFLCAPPFPPRPTPHAPRPTFPSSSSCRLSVLSFWALCFGFWWKYQVVLLWKKYHLLQGIAKPNSIKRCDVCGGAFACRK